MIKKRSILNTILLSGPSYRAKLYSVSPSLTPKLFSIAQMCRSPAQSRLRSTSVINPSTGGIQSHSRVKIQGRAVHQGGRSESLTCRAMPLRSGSIIQKLININRVNEITRPALLIDKDYEKTQRRQPGSSATVSGQQSQPNEWPISDLPLQFCNQLSEGSIEYRLC